MLPARDSSSLPFAVGQRAPIHLAVNTLAASWTRRTNTASNLEGGGGCCRGYLRQLAGQQIGPAPPAEGSPLELSLERHLACERKPKAASAPSFQPANLHTNSPFARSN
mgnify:CR=1 FL=1